MKNKNNIELQVSDLTAEQKNAILKIGKYYMLALTVVVIPVFIYVVINFLKVLQVEKYADIANAIMKNNIIALGVVLVYIIISLVFVRVKFPFYSDKKYKYLKKNKSTEN